MVYCYSIESKWCKKYFWCCLGSRESNCTLYGLRGVFHDILIFKDCMVGGERNVRDEEGGRVVWKSLVKVCQSVINSAYYLWYI